MPVRSSRTALLCKSAKEGRDDKNTLQWKEVKSSMKKTILKVAFAVVLISLCAFPFAYSGFFPPQKTRIFFTFAPSIYAEYDGPNNDYIAVEAGVGLGSTYGPFAFLLVEQGKQDASGVWHCVDHWYTDNVLAGQKYALLYVRLNTDATDVFSYDVTMALIVVTSSSPDQFSISVSAWTRTGKISITAEFNADTTVDIAPKLNGGLGNTPPNPAAQFIGVTARRAGGLLPPTITGVPFGDTTFSRDNSVFRYIRTELYDPSLLW